MLFLNAQIAQTQDKCGTDQYELLHKNKLLNPENEAQFENWISKKISESKAIRPFSTKADEILIIPVVVHVIHQGEELGSKSNIPDEQILSQIELLNKDFRRLNADAVNTPLEFLPVASDVRLEFALARRDPDGLLTNGIVRQKGPLGKYGFSTDKQLKMQSYWPAEDYLNFWVTTLSDDFLGYAQFPVSNLPGLDSDQTISRLTDGIVVDFKYLGEGYNALAFSKGRTATHEIGHFLGLKHIWGSDCSINDYCEDTPNKSTSTQGCPVAGSIETCGSVDMFQNYLDLSDDDCMNLFTICQAQRMRMILENSPRRKSLLTSNALKDPIMVADDLGIKEIISPVMRNCEQIINPQVEVKNYGTNTITDFKISLYIDGNLVETKTENTVISELLSSIVSFGEITIPEYEAGTFEFIIEETNNSTDGNSENNVKSIQAKYSDEQLIPYFQNFNSTLSSWQLTNSNDSTASWSKIQAPYDQIDNQAMVLSYYQSSEEKFGELDMLISPTFDLSSLASADISFKYAYAATEGNITDVFTVAVSTDCGNSFPEENYIFQKFSPLLNTAGISSSAFIPEGADDWTEIDINITEYVGNENVVIGFIGHNGGGNNLYFDDFSFFTSENKLENDLALKSVEDIPPVTCDGNIFPSLEIKNVGINSITDFTIIYTIDGHTQSILIAGLNILPGKSYIARPDIRRVEDGEHEIIFELQSPNGNKDENIENNKIGVLFHINTLQEESPIRETFKDGILNENWSTIRPDSHHNWVLTNAPSETADNQAILVNGFNITELDVENWLISPSLKFSSSEASMSFKVSYANFPGRNDSLKVLLSLNCGLSYTEEVFDKRG